VNVREMTEKFEEQFLSPYAQLSSRSKGRKREEEKCEIRTDFQETVTGLFIQSHSED